MQNGRFLVLFIAMLTMSLSAQFAGGDGSPGDPYQVADAFNLYSVRFEPYANFIQTADIDLGVSPFNEFEGWEPIGMPWDPFTGTYDGNGFKMQNMYIERPVQDNIGLFGFVSGGTLHNIQLSSCEATGGSYSGILAGYLTSGATVTDCSSSGNITGSSYTGGLVGYNEGCTISGSYSAANVNGGMSAGGLTGENSTGSVIADCYARGAVTASDMAGGLTGYCMQSSLTNCYSTGSVTIDQWNMMVGGLIPYQDMCVINDCYWDIGTSGQPASSGGTGKLTVEMKDILTFTNWDFITPVWSIDSLNSGYPYLTWSIPEEPVSEFAGGTGSELDPYLIAEAYQLHNVRDHLDACFLQVEDIDLGVAPWNENEGWAPIGNDMNPFTGKYDGGNYTISNLTINRGSENFTGLFGFTNDIEFKNIVLADVNITGQDYTGSLAGYCYDFDPEFRNLIENCSSSGTIACRSNSGGLAGNLCITDINSCSSTCDVTSSGSGTGGLIGYAEECTVKNSNYNGTVIGGSYTGGLAGQTYHYCAVLNCYTGGSVTGSSAVGGLIGSAEGEIKDCYSTSDITAASYAGGLIGSANSWSNVFNCYSTGYVDCSGSYTGGFVGEKSEYEQHTVNCYWNTVTSGQQFSAGGEGRTTAEMKEQTTYHNWDFVTPVWNINETENDGYPTLEFYEVLPSEPFAGGTGTWLDPYLIATPAQLDSVRNHLSSSFLVTNDIYLDVYPWNEGDGWVPLNEYPDMFTGNFNGNLKHIYGLTVNNASYPGLFTDCDGAVFSNVIIDSVSINGYMLAGALATSCFNCTIEKCSSSGTITSSSQAGGLVGYLSGTTASECFSSCEVNSDDYAGGLFGVLRENSEVYDCYSKGAVNGNYYSGGFSGYVESSTLSDCYSAGQVNGISDIGGFAGYASASTASDCYWDTETSGQATSAAGQGKTTTEMNLKSTYSGWDFTNVWNIYSGANEGYPYFKWQNLPTAFGSPQNVRTEISGNDLIISWDPVQNTTYYAVLVSDDPYGIYSLLDLIEENSITINITGDRYFFYITACNEEKAEILKKYNSSGK